jgi:Raf kinase inhibitor-like YbhB/YbcL family protein
MEDGMALQLTSPAFAPGARIPVRHSCEGEDLSPPLAWSDVPAEAESLALFCDDPDAPAGTWHHWALFDLPPTTTELRMGYPRDATVGGTRQAVNDFGVTGYRGPCPPPGHGTHHYHFRLLALDVAKLVVRDRAKCREALAAARLHAIAIAELIGTYSR